MGSKAADKIIATNNKASTSLMSHKNPKTNKTIMVFKIVPIEIETCLFSADINLLPILFSFPRVRGEM